MKMWLQFYLKWNKHDGNWYNQKSHPERNGGKSGKLSANRKTNPLFPGFENTSPEELLEIRNSIYQFSLIVYEYISGDYESAYVSNSKNAVKLQTSAINTIKKIIY